MFGKLLAAAAASLAASATAGTLIEVGRYDLARYVRDSTITIHEQDGQLRIEQTDARGQHIILLYTGDRILDIDVQAGAYIVVDRERIERAKRADDPSAALRAALLAEVPAAYHARSGQIMGIALAPTTAAQRKVEIVGTKRFVLAAASGERCRIYNVIVSIWLRYEYCVPRQALPGAAEFLEASADMSQLATDFFTMLGLDGMRNAVDVYWSHAQQLSTFPLLVREFREQRLVAEYRVERIQSLALPSATFQRPGGLRQRGISELFADDRGAAFQTASGPASQPTRP